MDRSTHGRSRRGLLTLEPSQRASQVPRLSAGCRCLPLHDCHSPAQQTGRSFYTARQPAWFSHQSRTSLSVWIMLKSQSLYFTSPSRPRSLTALPRFVPTFPFCLLCNTPGRLCPRAFAPPASLCLHSTASDLHRCSLLTEVALPPFEKSQTSLHRLPPAPLVLPFFQSTTHLNMLYFLL